MAKVSVDKGQETKKHDLRIHVCHNGPEDKMYIVFGSSKHEIREEGQGNDVP